MRRLLDLIRPGIHRPAATALEPLAMPSRKLVLAALCLAWAATARADGRPPTVPTRDVDVVYQTARSDRAGHEQVLSQRMRWDAGLGKLRVDPPVTGVYMVLDYRTHQMLAVHEADRSVLEVNAAAATATPGVGKGAALTAVGSATVAGLPCSEWSTRDSAGRPAIVCLTVDGVLLRATSGNHILLEATSVRYGPMSAALFDAPPGYKRIAPDGN